MTDEIQTPESYPTLRIEEEMKTSYLNYAMSVIVSRALPDVRDGLKPSQRRIMVAMDDLNLGPTSKFRKCAKIAGDTSGNYHPHGESVIYPTLVRLGQEWVMRYRLVDGQGNFGSVDGDPPAAMRYTEARMTRFSRLMMEDIDKETVDFRANYDETREEPEVLPAKFPNLLCNGSSGIAVGMATSIPPHNLSEIVDALVALIDNPEITIDEIMEHLPAPDFPSGGIICGTHAIKQAYHTGRGILRVRGRVEIEEGKKKDSIIITEIPYNVSKAKMIERIADLVRDGKMKGISDLRDESDRNGMRVVVELRAGEDPQLTLNQLYKHSQLQDSFSIINIALVDGRPQLLNIKEMLEKYKEHRIEVIRRRTRYLLDQAEREAHILEGLVIALSNIDEVIEIIKAAPDQAGAREKLIERFALSEIQANAILNMRLGRLTNLEQEKIQADLQELRVKIADYKSILADENLVLDIIREDLFEMKEKYGDTRRTEIGDAIEKFDIEDLIPVEDMVVVMSHEGYIKRVPLGSYRKQARGGKGVIGADTKEGDFIEHIFVCQTHDYILFFTDRGKVYWQKVYDIPQMGRTAKGRAVVNLLRLAEDENITSAIPVKSFDEGYLVTATKNGYIKKTELKAYGRPKKGGIIAVKLEDGDQLIGVKTTGGEGEIILGTRNGMAIRFSESDVRPMGRASRGVGGVKLRDGDEVCDMITVDPSRTLLTICENGYGKKTSFEEYRVQTRNGKGIINIKASERNGKVVGMKAVSDSDELMIISSGGIMIRIPTTGIRVMGRATQGVRVISLKGDDSVVSIARISDEEEDDTGRTNKISASSAPTPPPVADDTDAPEPADDSDGS
jgi:DNA gyrase subunit A